MIEIVFFDAGETLIHPHPSFPELFATVCRGQGHDIAADHVADVQERLAPHLVDLAEETGVEHGPSLSARDSEIFWTFLYRRLLAELDLPDDLAPELYRVFSDSATYRLFDDALPVLNELGAAGYRLGLISNFEGWLEKILVEQEVGHLFDTTVISGVEGVEKPDPGIYRLALERSEVDAARTVHVGDSMKLDVEPARSVGINPILIDRAGRYPDADCPTISSLAELPGVVARLTGVAGS